MMLRQQGPFALDRTGAFDPYWTSTGMLVQQGEPAGGAAHDLSRPNHTLTLNNGTAYVTGNDLFNSHAINFDGINDYAVTDSSSDFGFDAGEYTIDILCQPFDASGDRCLLDTRSASNTGIGIYTSVGGDTKINVADNAAVIATSTSTVPANATYFIRIVRTGTTVKVFVNGTQYVSVADSRTYASSAFATLGANYVPGQYWRGTVGHFRVTKGVARSTAAYTQSSLDGPFPVR